MVLLQMALLWAAACSTAETTSPPGEGKLATWVNSSIGIHRFLTFDYRATAEDIAKYGHMYDYVWGAAPEKVKLWKAANPSIITSQYIPIGRDYEECITDPPAPSGGRRIAWWREHHPSWVVYKSDRKTPAYSYADVSCVPLDISNPEVIAFQLNNCTAPAKARGFDAIAVDNFGWTNDFGASGVFRDGHWVEMYNGTDVHGEPFARDIDNWIAVAAPAIRKQGMLVIPNWSTYGSTPWNSTRVFAMTNLTDGLANEAGFVSLPERCGTPTSPLPGGGSNNITSCGWSEEAWINNLNWVLNQQAHGKAMYNINYWGTVAGATTQMDVPTHAIDWIMGSYLMTKGDVGAGVCIGCAAGGNLSLELSWPEYGHCPIGTPLEPPAPLPGNFDGVWRRRFSNGVVFVHPRGSSTEGLASRAGKSTFVQLSKPACTCRGERVLAGKLRIGPLGAAILLDSCSA